MKKILSKITGNKFSQRILNKSIQIAQYLMGIGSGSGVNNSGEKAIFDLLLNKIEGPYCIFDVGANKGQFLNLAIDNLTNKKYSLHSFEPGAKTFEILTKNKYKDNITLNNIGLGCDNEDLTLYYDVQGSGLASLTKRKLDHFNIDFNESEIVKIKTLDSYCSDNKINHIHLLKIDVEGHELDVLAGANKMFLNNSIDMVTFEFGGCNIDTRTFFQEFWYFFTKNDMDIYRITPSGYLYKLEQYKEIIEQYRTTNFIAIKKIILTLNPG